MFVLVLFFAPAATGMAADDGGTVAHASTEASAGAHCANTGSQHTLTWSAKVAQYGYTSPAVSVTWTDEYLLWAEFSYNGIPETPQQKSDTIVKNSASYEKDHDLGGEEWADGYDPNYVSMSVEVKAKGSLDARLLSTHLSSSSDADAGAGVCNKSDFHGPPPEDICSVLNLLDPLLVNECADA